MLYSFFLIIMKNVGRSSAFRPRYPNIYYRTKNPLPEISGSGFFHAFLDSFLVKMQKVALCIL